MLKWMVESNPSSYYHDIFGVSFVTLFPWMASDDINDNFATALSLDILNPHPYTVAKVEIYYRNETKNNLTKIIYDIQPYTHKKVSNLLL